YNNEGIIEENDLIGFLSEYAVDGTIEIKRVPYRKYKSKVRTINDNLYELLIYIQRKPIPKLKVPIKTTRTKETSWQPQTQKYLKSPLNYIGGKYKL
ncbi:DNA adenine methylase, partial [Enterococcus faecalis]